MSSRNCRALGILILMVVTTPWARAAIESAPLVSSRSLAPGIHLRPPTTLGEQSAFTDQLGLPAMSRDEKVQLRTIAMNEAMGICACSSIEKATSKSKPIGQTSLVDANGQRFAVSVVNFDLALRIFSDLQQLSKKTGGSLIDGCYARAQEMAYALEKRGYIVGKIMATGRFRVLTDTVKKGSVDWSFHVAPVIVVDDGTKRSVWVLDPSLFSEPVPAESWLALLMQNPRAKLNDMFVTNRFVFHPNHREIRLTNWRATDMKTAKSVIRDLNLVQH